MKIIKKKLIVIKYILIMIKTNILHEKDILDLILSKKSILKIFKREKLSLSFNKFL